MPIVLIIEQSKRGDVMNIAYFSIAVALFVLTWLFTKLSGRMNIAYHSIAVALFVLTWLLAKLSGQVDSGESILK
jgi:VIT1/CCC1 family predicted Fe2+/Mn2+ transporter